MWKVMSNFDLRWKYGNFLNLLLERIMQTVFIAFKSDRIGAILYFKPFTPIAYHFTTAYSIHKHPVILQRKPKTSSITWMISNIIRKISNETRKSDSICNSAKQVEDLKHNLQQTWNLSKNLHNRFIGQNILHTKTT